MKGMDLLRKKIDESGYKLRYIAEKCGLSYQGFKNKLDGETEFKTSEACVLRDLLKLTQREFDLIFLVSS